MIPEQDLYSQAVSTFQADDLAKARDLFSQLLKINPKNVSYWLWMSAAVETPKERAFCLCEVLRIDPENEEAAQGLRMLGEKAPDLAATPPSQSASVPWKTQLELADENPTGRRGLRSRIAVYSLLGLAILAFFGFGISLALKPSPSANDSPIKRWTFTPLPTATQTLTPTLTSSAPVPLVIALDSTFTPTPIYAVTPHNRLEAYAAGMRAYEKGDWAKAADFFNQVLVDEPNDADVYYHLGDVYRYQGAYDKALTAYQTAISLNTTFAPPYLGIALLDLYGPVYKIDEASMNLQKAINLDPNLNLAYLELANVMLAQGSPEAALGYLDRLDATMSKNALVELDRAEAYLAQGKIDQALTAIKQANQYDRSLLPVYQVWAQILQTQGDYTDSIAPLLTVLNNAPANLQATLLLAHAYFGIGETEKALPLINECLQQDDKFIDAYLLRADIYLSEKQLDSARSDFDTVLHLDANNFEANLGIGKVLLAQTLAGGAYNQFKASEKLASTDAQKAMLLYWRANSLLAMDETTAAIKNFSDALAFPANSLPPALKADAEAQLKELVTPTPTPTTTPTPQKSTPTPAAAKK